MDAEYLKKNVMEALTEALTSMAINTPEDKIEFIGRYLLQYVERKQVAFNKKEELVVVEQNFAKYQQNQEVVNRVEAEKNAIVSALEAKNAKAHASIATDFKTKRDAISEVLSHLEESVPAAYFAEKKTVGEVDTLHYTHVGPSQSHIEGSKLIKVVVDESEEGAPKRQGVSFEAFKVPEAPEEEEVELEEGEERPPKIVLTAQPLVIENTMRDTRVKFFGIPKLGAFVAVPFSYQTIDHAESCVLNAGSPAGEGEDTTPAVAAGWGLVKKESQFLLCVDSIGKYRVFKPAEIARIKALGEQLIIAFENVEKVQGETTINYLTTNSHFKSMPETCAAISAKIAEDEVTALTTAATEIAAAGESPPETLKAYKESEAVLDVWCRELGNIAFINAVESLTNYQLAMPQPVVNLLYAVALLAQLNVNDLIDVCKEPSWKVIGSEILPGGTLTTMLGAYYKVNAPRDFPAVENSFASIKAYAEANTLSDVGLYPAHFPVFGLLSGWLGKALVAREAAIAYHLEVNKVNLDDVV